MDGAILLCCSVTANRHEWEHWKFHTNVRKNFIPVRVPQGWNRMPREAVQSLSQVIVKTRRDAFPCSRELLYQRVGLMSPSGPIQPLPLRELLGTALRRLSYSRKGSERAGQRQRPHTTGSQPALRGASRTGLCPQAARPHCHPSPGGCPLPPHSQGRPGRGLRASSWATAHARSAQLTTARANKRARAPRGKSARQGGACLLFRSTCKRYPSTAAGCLPRRSPCLRLKAPAF